MIKNNLMKAVFAALLLVSATANAGGQYPAENFKPEIISQDADYIAKHSRPSSNNTSSSSYSVASESSSSASSSAASAPERSSAQASPVEQNGWLILVVVVLGGVIAWTSKNSASKASAPIRVAAPAVAGGETGVAKYLRSRDGTPASVGAALTGVAKYLANRGG